MNEVVAITGASAGIGRATVREFAKRGSRIGLIARGVDRLKATQREVQELGGQAIPLPADVADPDQVERAAQRLETEFGPIGIWINNAVANVIAPFWEITPAEYKRATEVMYLGYVHGTLSALQRMRRRNRGTIVQVGSGLAFRSIPLNSVYCGAKCAIVGFTDSIRSELIHEGSAVHLTAVHLSAVNTPQFSWCRTRLAHQPQPIPPIFDPAVAARAIHFAAHSRRREMYVGYPAIAATYGNQLAPGIGDYYLGKTGYWWQQTNEPVAPGRPDNLFEPAEGDWSAEGPFGKKVRRYSPQLWFDTHRGAVGAALAGAALAALSFSVAGRRNS